MVCKQEIFAIQRYRERTGLVLKLDRDPVISKAPEQVQVDGAAIGPHGDLQSDIQLRRQLMQLPSEGMLKVSLGMKEGSALRKAPHQPNRVDGLRETHAPF